MYLNLSQAFLKVFMLKRQLREVETRAHSGIRERDRPLRPLGPMRGPPMGPPNGPPISPRDFDGPPRRYDGPPLSPDHDRKHGLPRDMHPRYEKRMR